jgi:Tfp pilus assembly protein FimT
MKVFGSNTRNSAAGFGILEISIVVMIAGIITAASVIMFGKGKARYQLSRKAQSITWQIDRARSLAVKYNQTLTLGFTSQNSAFGLTCTGCTEAKSELPTVNVPSDITLSAHPTITIKGNGTISATSGTIVVSDGQGRQVPITISNSGRTTVGDLYSTTH